MAYEAKTNWKLDDTVMPEDMNRIEQGIKNVELSLEDVGGITILEASTDNVIDFNTLTEEGIYLIKNCNGNTTQNGYITDASAYHDFYLIVKEVRNIDTGNTTSVFQQLVYSTMKVFISRGLNVSTNIWTSWSYKITAGFIEGGTLAGKVLANATAVATLDNAQVRNIQASTTDLTAGTSSLATGEVYFVFE